jgi:uncharacterized OsmC-like protein
MTPLPHYYDVQLTAGPAGYADVSTAGLPGLRTAPPADYDGPGDAWSPEHLLLAAVQACFLFTVRASARFSNVDFVNLDLHASGTVDRQERVTRFTEIVLYARLTVPAGADRERAMHVLEKSKQACLISASLSTPTRLVADVQETNEPVRALSHSR